MQLNLRRALLLAFSLSPSLALAIEYEVPIDVDDEEGLYELAATDQIEPETLEALIELYQRGVDLNRADRAELYALPNLSYAEVDAILAYRGQAGWIADPAELVDAGVLERGKLESIAAFLVINAPGRLSADGWIKGQTRMSQVRDGGAYVGDRGAPASALQARLTTARHLTLGLAGTLTRTRLGDVRYDPTRDALSVEAPSDRVALPKLYARWDTPGWGAIVGTYRIGFGQRLTFDNTRLYSPNGFVPDDQLLRTTDLTIGCKELAGELGEAPCDPEIRITPDYRWQDGMLGAAATAKRVPLGAAELQATGFVSYQPRDVYQYELYDPSQCADPTQDDLPECASPAVYARQDDILAPTSRWAYSTLPDMFAETTVGGNLGVEVGRRDRVGLTAYTSSIDFLPEGIALDFQEWSRFPRGGRFGAVGVDGAVGVGPVDLFAEVTRSFDAIPEAQGGGGGFGGITRAVISPRKRDELELSLRWYGEGFANPSARAIAASDVVNGLRARDERGARLRYGGTFAKRLSLRAIVDLWQTPSNERWNEQSSVRGDYALSDQYAVGLRLQHHDKGVGENGIEGCFETGEDMDERGEVIPCSGQRVRAAPRFRYTPTKGYAFTAQYEHTWVDDPMYIGGRFRQDGSVTLTASALPIERFGLRGRVRYLDRDVSEGDTLGSYVSSYLEVRVRPRPRDWLRLRYDNVAFFGESPVLGRLPTQHWLWLSYEARY